MALFPGQSVDVCIDLARQGQRTVDRRARVDATFRLMPLEHQPHSRERLTERAVRIARNV
jgi:hypothetical protein